MRQLLPISMPQWYRGFDPIQVPFEEAQPGQLPDILGMVANNAARAPNLGQGTGSGGGQGGGTGTGTGAGSNTGTGGGTGGWVPGSGTVPRDFGSGQIDWGTIAGVLGIPSVGWDTQDPTSDFPVRPGAAPAPYEIAGGTFGIEGDPEDWDQAKWEEWRLRNEEWRKWWEENRDTSQPGGGTGGSAPDPTGGGGGSTGQQPTDYAQWPGIGGIDIPPTRIPPSVGFEPDRDAIRGGIGAIGDLIEGGGFGGGIPQLMPGDLPLPGGQTPVGAGGGQLGGWLARFNALGDIANYKEDPRGAFVGATTLVNPLVGALAGGYLALTDVLNNKNSSGRQDARDYYNEVGAAYFDQLLPSFWTEGLGRNPDWIYGNRQGTGQSDAEWLQGFQSWLGSDEGVGGRAETPFQNFGKMSPQEAGPAIAEALWRYMQINPIESGMGPGDFAPQAQLDRLYGTQDQSHWYDLNSFAPIAHGGYGQNFEGLGLAMETIPNRLAAARGIESDPAWSSWASEFSQLRPNVALPQAGSYVDPQLAAYWDWIEQNRQRMGG